MKNSKVVKYILELLFVYVNLGYLGLFAVGFMHLCLLVLKCEHFGNKKFSKIVFRATQKIVIFEKMSKTTLLLQSAVTKPFN